MKLPMVYFNPISTSEQLPRTVFIAGNLHRNVPTCVYGPHKVVTHSETQLILSSSKPFNERYPFVFVWNREVPVDDLNVAQINALMRSVDESHLYPVNGRFNATERAIRRLQGQYQGGFEYLTVLEAEISKIVNSEV